MLLGNEQADAASGEMGNSPVIFDVSAADFEDRVLKASTEKPILIQFWAPWCGPCKQLGPLLEKAVQAAGGEVLLAKVNLDDNQELGAALRVQSVPTVFAIFQGRPVDAFQGVVPESQIKEFINKALLAARQAQPDAIDIPEALKAAADALAEKDVATAHGVYSQILSQDQQNVKAFVGLIRTFIVAGQVEQAQQLIENAPEEISSKPEFAEAQSAVEMATMKTEGSAEDFSALLIANPANHQVRFDLAMAQFTEGQQEKSIDNLLEIIKEDPAWNEEAARKQLLKFFEAMGHADPLTMAARRKLSTILFS